MTANPEEAAGSLGIPLKIRVAVREKARRRARSMERIRSTVHSESSVKTYDSSCRCNVSNRGICQHEIGCAIWADCL